MGAQRGPLPGKPLIELPRGKRTLFFVILYGLFMFDFIARIGINAIYPIIQEDLQLSDSQVGLAVSVVLFAMAFFVLPNSFLGEKHSIKKGITLSSLVWGVGTLLSAAAGNFFVLLGARFCVGIGNAAYAPMSNSMITSLYPKQAWGKQIGLYDTAMTIGMAIGALLFANFATLFGWRAAFVAVGVISLLLCVASLALPDPTKILKERNAARAKAHPEGKPPVELHMKDAIGVLVKNKSLMGVCLGAAVISMISQGTTSWSSIFFVREMHLSMSQMTIIIAVLALSSAAGYPIGGALMDKLYMKDRRARMFVPVVCVALSMLSFILAYVFLNLVFFFFGGFILSMAGSSYHVSTQDLVPSWYKSVAYGVYVVFVQFLGAVGPLLIGTLSEHFGLIISLIFIQLFNIIPILVFLLTSRTYERDLDKARAIEKNAEILEV